MTKVTMTNIGNRYEVTMVGHANYDDFGRDIVCAGISSLAQAFSFYIYQLDDAGKVEIIEDEIRGDIGLFILRVEGDIKDIKPAYEMLYLGLKSIAESYPNNCVLVG